MSNFNYAGVAVTEKVSGAQSQASATAIPERQMQVISWSGSSSINSCVVTLAFGSTEQANHHANSGIAAGEYYGDNGPIAAENTAVTVTTDNRKGGIGWSSANLVYRIVV